MRIRRSSPSPSPIEQENVNLTPLIDVVFVVLILFILIVPLLEIDKVQLAKASIHEQAQTASPERLTIHVEADDTIKINQEIVSHSQLKNRLHSLRMRNPKATPQLYQDKKGTFGTYQLIKNAAEEVGFETLDVVLAPNR